MWIETEVRRGRRCNSKKLRPKRCGAGKATNVGDPNRGASSKGKKKD